MSFWKTSKDKKKDSNLASILNEGSELSESNVRVNSAPRATSVPKERCAVPKGMRLQGVLNFDSPVLISGSVKGSIISSSKVIIAKEAKVTASIRARSLQVSGFVSGNIEVQDSVVVNSGAQVNGKLQASTLEVRDAATVNAECLVYKDKKSFSLLKDSKKSSLFTKNAA